VPRAYPPGIAPKANAAQALTLRAQRARTPTLGGGSTGHKKITFGSGADFPPRQKKSGRRIRRGVTLARGWTPHNLTAADTAINRCAEAQQASAAIHSEYGMTDLEEPSDARDYRANHAIAIRSGCEAWLS
jgi:hypothetical protein